MLIIFKRIYLYDLFSDYMILIKVLNCNIIIGAVIMVMLKSKRWREDGGDEIEEL